MEEMGKERLRRSDLLPVILTFFLVCGLLCALFGGVEYQSVQQQRTRCQYMAANQANILRDGVDSALSRAYTLRALLIHTEGDTAFFDAQGAALYTEANQDSGMVLKNIAVAPGGVVEKVYPMEGNESLVGFNFMDVSQPGNQEAVEAYHRGELVVTAPFTLVQGGMGMAGRLPIFLKDGDSNSFWGLVTVTMDMDRLLQAFRLNTLEDLGLDYVLWCSDSSGQRMELAGTAQAPRDPVSHSFSLANQSWVLEVSPHSGWVDLPGLLLKFAVSLIIALLMALLRLDKTRLHSANRMLAQLAIRDSLTLCYSRHYVNTVLIDQRTGQWHDPHVRYALAVIDIDRFKHINDTYGHELGDRAIVAVAQVLMDAAKQASGDCVIRFGGDEFILLFNDVTRERFQNKLSDILTGVREIRFAEHPEIRLSISAGGVYDGGPTRTDYYKLVEQADQCLYQAKEAGRDRCCVQVLQ